MQLGPLALDLLGERFQAGLGSVEPKLSGAALDLIEVSQGARRPLESTREGLLRDLPVGVAERDALFDQLERAMGRERLEGDRPFVCSHELGSAFEVRGENLYFETDRPFSMYALAALPAAAN